MMHVLEFILEFILLGSIDAVSSKRVPMGLRIIVAFLLLAIYLGLFALLLITGIQAGNAVLIVAACIVLIAVAVLVISKIKQIKYQNK